MSEPRRIHGVPQWYSSSPLSEAAQELLLKLDLIDVADDVLDDFIAARNPPTTQDEDVQQ
jgi:hypothetical protein